MVEHFRLAAFYRATPQCGIATPEPWYCLVECLQERKGAAGRDHRYKIEQDTRWGVKPLNKEN